MSDYDLHVTPINDVKEHVDVGGQCWCKPRLEEAWNGETARVWVHNSADNREHFEPGHQPCDGCGFARRN